MSKMGTSTFTPFGMTIPYRAFPISTLAAFCATGVVSFEIEMDFIDDSSMDTGFSVKKQGLGS